MSTLTVGPIQNTPLLQVEDLTVRFGGHVALDRVSLAVPPGIITALIGPNGAGKSTLINAISGFQRVASGRILLRNQQISHLPAHRRIAMGMARTFQDLEVLPRLTVLENTLLGLPAQPGEALVSLFTAPRYSRRQLRLGKERAMSILESVGLTDRANRLAGDLGFGEQKLLVLARLLATDTELFMLDEPGAGLPARQIDEIGSILGAMAGAGKTVLLVDHNMRLVMNYAQFVIVLHHGNVIAEGSPDEIQQHPEVIKVYLSR